MSELPPPLRVLRLIARLNVGGPARHAVILNDGLRQRGFETLLVHGSPGPGEGSLDDLARDRDLPTIHIPELGRRISILSDVRAFARIVALLWRWQPDIVHTHTAKAGTLGRIAALFYNVAARRSRRCVVIHTFHGHVLEGYFGRLGSLLVRWVERTLGFFTDRVVTISARQREDITRKFAIVPPTKVAVVPLGLELGELLALAERPPGPRVPLEHVVLGYVGRLVPIKDLGTLVRGVAQARLRIPGLELVLAGDGEERASLEALVTRLGLGAHVAFLGWRSDLPALYGGMDLFVLTSLNEGTPVSLIEAMAAGVPVVATAVGGVPDVIEDGVSGVLIPPREPEAVAAAITDALLRPGRAACMAARARSVVRERFHSVRLVQETETMYRQAVLQSRRGVAGPPRPDRSRAVR